MHFKDLSYEDPQSEVSLQEWEQNYSFIKGLLLEIGKDVYDGWGEIWGKREGPNYNCDGLLLESRIGLYLKVPSKWYLIGISPANNAGFIRVVGYFSDMFDRKYHDVPFENLLSFLRSLVSFFIKHGLHDDLRKRHLWFKDFIEINQPSISNLIGKVDRTEIDLFTLDEGTYLRGYKQGEDVYRSWYTEKKNIANFFNNLVQRGYEFFSSQYSTVNDPRNFSYVPKLLISELTFHIKDSDEIINFGKVQRGTEFYLSTNSGRPLMKLEWNPEDERNFEKWSKAMELRCLLSR